MSQEDVDVEQVGKETLGGN